jgi:hypothetical protein
VAQSRLPGWSPLAHVTVHKFLPRWSPLAPAAIQQFMHRANSKDKVVGCSGLSFGFSLKRNFDEDHGGCLPAVAHSKHHLEQSTWWFRSAHPGGLLLLLQHSNGPCTGPKKL